MATAAHTIYSHYDPTEYRTPLRGRTSESSGDTCSSETWEFDPTFKAPLAPPPRFVPATLTASTSFDTLTTQEESSPIGFAKDSTSSKEVSSWYRLITSSTSDSTLTEARIISPRLNESLPHVPTYSEKRNKNNWFIMNAIQSEPTSQPTRSTSSPSLADIIARDPPPLPTEGRFVPPVWLQIGPSNKGFVMLQRSGWSEGEPLGPDVLRKTTVSRPLHDMIRLEGKNKPTAVKQEILEVNIDGYDDIVELRHVVDLTVSDSEPGLENDEDLPNAIDSQPIHYMTETTSSTKGVNDPYGRTALLTPIATVLKSDRLGLGLKAKTVGPYKASQKRVTHNAAALAAHARGAEKSRRWRKQFGRGRKGFAVRKNREEADRRNFLAYMNS